MCSPTPRSDTARALSSASRSTLVLNAVPAVEAAARLVRMPRHLYSIVSGRRTGRVGNRAHGARSAHRRPRAGVREAGRPRGSGWSSACRSRRWETSTFPRAGPLGLMDLARIDQALARRGGVVDCAGRRDVQERPPAGPAATRRRSCLTAVRPIVRELRGGARARECTSNRLPTSICTGTRRCSTRCSTTTSSPISPPLPFAPRSRGWEST